jgi:hypothetical protein
MLKMKEPPGMCMKTKERTTKWPIINRAFWPKMHQLRDDGRQSIELCGGELTQHPGGTEPASPDKLLPVLKENGKFREEGLSISAIDAGAPFVRFFARLRMTVRRLDGRLRPAPTSSLFVESEHPKTLE